jgi:hypothetical protein
MKIGINLIGIANGGVGNYNGQNRNRDHKKSVKEFYEFIVNPLIAQGHEVFFYLYTYVDANQDELIKDYPPTKATFITLQEVEAEQRFTGMSIMALNHINSLRELQNEDLDLVINTRFDIKFLKNPFESYQYDFSKINFLWKEPEYHSYPIVNDTFIVFPHSMVQPMIDGLKTLCSDYRYRGLPGLHNYYLSLLEHTDTESVQWVRDEYVTHEMNDLYEITREGWGVY